MKETFVSILRAVAMYNDKYKKPCPRHLLEKVGVKKSDLKKMVRKGHLEERYFFVNGGYITGYVPKAIESSSIILPSEEEINEFTSTDIKPSKKLIRATH